MATITTTSPAKGLLLEAFKNGQTSTLQWAEITVGDLIITVASDAMSAPLLGRAGVRLPVTYGETVEICRALGCIAPTQTIADAIFAQAKSKACHVPLTRTAADANRIATVEFVLRFDDSLKNQLKARQPEPGLTAGAWKYWILHPRLVERGAVNYGAWDTTKTPPKLIQAVGALHDASRYDYTQLLQPVKRLARRVSTGEEVDLLVHIASQDKVPEDYLSVYR